MASSTTTIKLLVVATYAAIFVNNLSSATLPRPRGVPISKASLYHPEKGHTWQCLDGSKILRYNQLNDDYCDCPDGSDEPGTAACSNGIFHCANIGYQALEIPTSRVDDFVCDCCDGSDEAGTLQCPNTCMELGRVQMEQDEKAAETLKKGSEKRNEMMKKGKQMKADRETKKAELERRLAELTAIKNEKEVLKQAAEQAEQEALELYKLIGNERDQTVEDSERPPAVDTTKQEAEAAFSHYDTNKDGFIEVTELQVDIALDKDHNGVVTVEEAKYFLDERDRIDLENFLSLSWPRIKPMKMLAQGLFTPPEADNSEELHEQTELLKDPESPSGPAHHEGEEEEEEEEHYEDEDTGVGVATPDTRPPPNYDPETQRLIDTANEARQALTQAENDLRTIENEIKEIVDHNTRDYGVNEEYAALEGECFNYEDREYIYSLCPFNRATQKPKSGGSETTLGRWDHWISEGQILHAKQKYSHGASCWNGPQRSAIVKLKCAVDHRLISVAEPNRCEYYFEFETPAACNADAVPPPRDPHDEL